jgi:hypothetical protein
LSSTGAIDYNPNNGAALLALEEAIKGHNNNPVAMQKRKDRIELAKKTKQVEEATKKLPLDVPSLTTR